ncbi:histidine kinase [Rugamonas sp. CCM 8940]|uniref:histidine kinase n=1 Tax=Rugamonas sp. CCM 8940 TaxID=2765359 RepID=UPI003616F030
MADAKLKALPQRVVESQEERARLSRDLHDGISQWLVSIKLQIEAGIIRLTGDAGQRQPPRRCSNTPPSSSTTCSARCAASRTTCARPSSTTSAWPPRWPTWPRRSP